jgi:hypothetical protein
MTNANNKGGSIARKVSIVGSVGLAVVLLAICTAMSLMVTASSPGSATRPRPSPTRPRLWT